MTDNHALAHETLESLQAKYEGQKHSQACQLGAIRALVTRLAIEIDVVGDDEIKENVKQILLDYKSR